MQLSRENIEILLDKSVSILEKYKPGRLSKQQGAKFEPVLVEVLRQAARELGVSNLKPEGVELVSGHKFPDILIHTNGEVIGVEVKTSQKGWTTLGGSIFESTRVVGVETIYIFFANFADPNRPAFRFADHEMCISDVIITHKPRYAIDLDTEQTLFEKSGIRYAEIQSADNPFLLIRDYMKEKSGPNTDLWWVGKDDEEQVGPQSIKLWGDIPEQEKSRTLQKMYAIFPEVLSNNNKTKYVRPSLFLISKLGILCKSIRDPFSAGGKYQILSCDSPRYLQYISDKEKVAGILNCLKNDISYELLSEYWGEFDDAERVRIWKRAAIEYIDTNPAIEPEVGRHLTELINQSRA